jgi:hypothetical protein
MNTIDDIWVGLAVLAVLWAVCVYLLTRLEPPVEPAEFGALCDCGHPFSDHATDPHGPFTRCSGLTDSWGATVPCACDAFEPLSADERPTEPMTTLPAPRRLSSGYDVDVYLDHGVDRIALTPVGCGHCSFAVEVEGGGGPLKCLTCGEELSE